jgi:ketosteroid isomerase-like protein
MPTKANELTGRLRLRLRRDALRPAAYVVLTLNILFVGHAAAAPEDEVRATFERFVAAQNAHETKAVESLLQDSPTFLWITRGVPVWGREAALKRFAALYEGTWRLDPEAAGLRVMMIGDAAAQIYVPIMFNIGAPGQAAQPTRFLMNLVVVKTAGIWKVSSILPIPAPAQ